MKALGGRMNRASYWACVGIVAALLAGIALIFGKPPRVHEIVLVFLCVPRLHDIGRSGWWVAAPLAFEVGATILAFVLLPHDLALGVASVVVLILAGLLVWLGCIPGQPGENRFGEAPRGGVELRPRPKQAGA